MMRGLAKKNWFKLGAFSLIFLIFLILLIYVILDNDIPGIPVTGGPLVQKYHVVIKPVSFQAGTFIAKETITIYPDIEINLPERQITDNPRGLVLREISFLPIGTEELQLPDGTPLSWPLCGDSCPESTIELFDFPKDSFYAAKGAEGLTALPYIDTEEITWSTHNIDNGIVFAFFPPPFQYVRPIIEPFIGQFSVSKYLLGFFGFIGTIVITPIVKPVVTDKLQKKFSNWLEKLSKQKRTKGKRK